MSDDLQNPTSNAINIKHTCSGSTIPKAAIFSRSALLSGFSLRHISKSGIRPLARKFRTLFCIGFVFGSPVVFGSNMSETCTEIWRSSLVSFQAHNAAWRKTADKTAFLAETLIAIGRVQFFDRNGHYPSVARDTNTADNHHSLQCAAGNKPVIITSDSWQWERNKQWNNICALSLSIQPPAGAIWGKGEIRVSREQQRAAERIGEKQILTIASKHLATMETRGHPCWYGFHIELYVRPPLFLVAFSVCTQMSRSPWINRTITFQLSLERVSSSLRNAENHLLRNRIND